MFRYWGHYTDAAGDPVALDVHMRAHAHVEDHIRRLKDSGADRFPFVDIDANRAWLAVVCFADALVRWFQLLCLTGPLAVAEPKTLRWSLWHTPARLVHHARRHIVRILDGWPTTDSAARRLPAHRPHHLTHASTRSNCHLRSLHASRHAPDHPQMPAECPHRRPDRRRHQRRPASPLPTKTPSQPTAILMNDRG